jgi:hypothetical protein
MNNDDKDPEQQPENQPNEPGAEGGAPSSEPQAPFAPHEDDDSALGDTDQHSDA